MGPSSRSRSPPRRDGSDNNPSPGLSLNYIANLEGSMRGSQTQTQGAMEPGLAIEGGKADERRVLAFAADACALCCLQCTGVFILGLYLAQIGLWSWIFHEVYTAMPQTFAWEKLLRTYGSHYDDCIDRTESVEIELKSRELCPNFYTMPCVPIIAIVLLILNFFSGSSCLSKPRSKRMYTMVASSATWQFLFTIIALAFTSYYFHTDMGLLEQSMKREMLKGNPVSSRWHLTQIVRKCCGIKSRVEWHKYPNNSTAEFPISCYPYQKPQPEAVYVDSCFGIEYAFVKFWGALVLGLLCTGLATSIFFLCLATAIHGGARGNWNQKEPIQHHPAGDPADIFYMARPRFRRHRHYHHRHGQDPMAGDGEPYDNLEDAQSQGFYVHQNNHGNTDRAK